MNTETLQHFISSQYIHHIAMWNASQEADTRQKTQLQQEAWQYFYIRHLHTFTVLLLNLKSLYLNANDTYQITYILQITK